MVRLFRFATDARDPTVGGCASYGATRRQTTRDRIR